MTWTTRTDNDLTNIHRRTYSDGDRAWNLTTQVADPRAGIWPTDAWIPMKLDAPATTLGARGGHGSIRYRVTIAEPERIRFTFDPKTALGWHEFRREGNDIVHELHFDKPSLLLRAIVPVHDALLEDLLDNIADKLDDPAAPPRKRVWPLRVRLLRVVGDIVDRRGSR